MAETMDPGLETAFVSLGLYVGCLIPSAVLIVGTSKRSPLRFLWAVPMVYIAYQFGLVASNITSSFTLNSVLMGQGLIGLLQCFNLLLITSLEDQDLVKASIYKPSAAFAMKLKSVFTLLINYRGIGTPWQAKNIPPFAAFYTNRSSRTCPSRFWYITRQGLIIAWQYLLLDIVNTSSRNADPAENNKLFGPGSEFIYLGATPEQWTGRVIAGAFGWFGPGRTVLDISSRLFCFPLVACGILSPSWCPPTFGSMADAYTIRGFWSKLWHQFLRWPLTSISNFLARDVLRLPRPSILERYTNIYFVFLGSGVFHLVHSYFLGTPIEESKAVLFFSSFALGVMIEDGVQEAWRRVSGQTATEHSTSKTPFWQKMVGFAWVVFWLMMTSPWYLYPNMRLPPETTWIVPVSIVDKTGMNTAVTVLAVGGLLLKFAIGGEL